MAMHALHAGHDELETKKIMDKNISFQNKNIHYTDVGSGHVLVLIHGFMESTFLWTRFSESLSAFFRVICIDLPGHGQTDIFGEVHPLPLQAQCINAVLENEKIEKCVIIGHSMGGYVTAQFAKDFSQKVQGFGFFHSHTMADSEHTKEFRNRTIELLRQDRKGFITQFIPDLFAEENAAKFPNEITDLTERAKQMPVEAIIASQIGMRDREDLTSVLQNTNTPVMFILGKHDTKSNVQKILDLQTQLPNHTEILIVNTGHMGFYEAEAETMGFVKNFVFSSFG